MIKLYLLNKNLVKPRKIYTETYYVSINEELVNQKKSDMENPQDYFITSHTVEAEEFPVFINGTLISSSTESFLESPFNYRVIDNPEYDYTLKVSEYVNEKYRFIKSSGLDIYLYKISSAIAEHPFISGAIEQAGLSLYEANDGFYMLPKPIATLDSETSNLRTEFQANSFNAEISNFNSYIKQILEYVGNKYVREDGLTEFEIVSQPETQAKITEILTEYLANK